MDGKGCGMGTAALKQGPKTIFDTVIPIRQLTERNLALSARDKLREESPTASERDSSSPSAPRNDNPGGYFRTLRELALSAAKERRLPG